MSTAQCTSCGRGFNVPSAGAGKTYKCPECGGRVQVASGDVESTNSAPPSAESPGRARANRDPNQRDAMRDYSRLRTCVGWLRVFGLIGMAVALLSLTKILNSHTSSSREFLLIATATVGGFFLLAGMGVLRADKGPLFWSVTLAVPSVALLGLLLWAGVPLLMPLIQGLYVTGLSVAVWKAWHFHKLMRENPELTPERRVRVNRSRRAKAPAPKVSTFAKARELAILGLTLLVLLPTFVWIVDLQTRDPEFEETADLFGKAWATASPQKIAVFYREQDRANAALKLRQRFRTRNWLTKAPELGERRIEKQVEEKSAVAAWQVDGGTLETHWALSQGKWRLTGLQYPERRSPPVKPTLEVFKAQWNSGTVPELASHFNELRRESRQRKLSRIFKRRGWDEKRPKIVDELVTDGGKGKARVNLMTTAGMIRTKWSHEEGRWVLTSFAID